jgi:hypothetical protein
VKRLREVKLGDEVVEEAMKERIAVEKSFWQQFLENER